MKVKVTGFSGIEAAMRELADPAAVRRAANRGMDKALEPVAEMARRLVPVDDGYLRAAIKVGSRAATKGNRRFKKATGGDVIERYVGIDASEAAGDSTPADLARYSIIRETGATERNDPATPYMRPAMDAELPNAPERLAPILWEELSKTAARKAKKAGRE